MKLFVIVLTIFTILIVIFYYLANRIPIEKSTFTANPKFNKPLKVGDFYEENKKIIFVEYPFSGRIYIKNFSRPGGLDIDWDIPWLIGDEKITILPKFIHRAFCVSKFKTWNDKYYGMGFLYWRINLKELAKDPLIRGW